MAEHASSFSLTSKQVECFKRDGVIVIPDVFSQEEIIALRHDFHRSLHDLCGLVVEDISALTETAPNLSKLSSTHGAGGILDMFYFDWKMRVNEDPRVVGAIQDLWASTYSSCTEVGEIDGAFSHPYGSFDPRKGFAYIDRVCFRLPDACSLRTSGENLNANFSKKKFLIQRSLTPHLDCCPHDMYNGQKWRPIQAFLALTDTLNPNEGGFEACLGLHREFLDWRDRRIPSIGSTSSVPPCVGQFTPMRPSEDADIIARMQHIPCRAGDLVCWDYRIPHSNAQQNTLETPREVIYIGLLPCIELNHSYAVSQLEKYKCGELPNDQWHKATDKQFCEFEFTQLGRRLMAIEPW